MSGLTTARARKPPDYYDRDRRDLIVRLRRPVGRVLDVGCGVGSVGTMLRELGASHLTGIEINPDVAVIAKERYDVVHSEAAEVALGNLGGPYDTVLCYDVLEHMVDPAGVLKTLHSLVASRGQLHVSVPNARHLALLRDLAFRGTFGYTDMGHRDSTHLRWFTRRDLAELLSATGWKVQDVSSTIVGRSLVLDRATFGVGREFLALQWQMLATPDRCPTNAGTSRGPPAGGLHTFGSQCFLMPS
jgi:2-polyprenyl-3-methyl-5-hydroxy-6-metoxy-1,4-benzoquinol methylase